MNRKDFSRCVLSTLFFLAPYVVINGDYFGGPIVRYIYYVIFGYFQDDAGFRNIGLFLSCIFIPILLVVYWLIAKCVEVVFFDEHDLQSTKFNLAVIVVIIVIFANLPVYKDDERGRYWSVMSGYYEVFRQHTGWGISKSLKTKRNGAQKFLQTPKEVYQSKKEENLLGEAALENPETEKVEIHRPLRVSEHVDQYQGGGLLKRAE